MSNTGHIFYKIIKIVFSSGLLIDNVNFSFLVYIYIVSVFFEGLYFQENLTRKVKDKKSKSDFQEN